MAECISNSIADAAVGWTAAARSHYLDPEMDASSELVVPNSRIGPLVVTIGCSVFMIFVVLAVRNLFTGTEFIASTLWLLLLGFVATSNIRESGWRSFFLGVLGAFASRQVLVVRRSDDSRSLGIGFRLFRFSVIQHRVPAHDIVSLSVHTGQASDLANRDVNDWSVGLWYLHHDDKRRGTRRPGQEVVIIGPARAKPDSETLARRIAGFLDVSGLPVPLELPGVTATR
jgi:hypothetical protein